MEYCTKYQFNKLSSLCNLLGARAFILGKKPKGFGFVVKNNGGGKKTDLYYNSIRQVERLTGYDFFPLLPDSLEDLVEINADLQQW